MRIWIICSGEAEAARPSRCTAGEYAALRKAALDGEIAAEGVRRVAANGRAVFCSPRRAALATAGAAIEDAEAAVEPLLDELLPQQSAQTGTKPFWMHGLVVSALRAEGRRRADALIEKLEERGSDCILISHPAMIEALMDALRVRGYCAQRTGLGRVRPFEQMLLSRRDEHCGGCQHNCLLSNPGCNIGRDKAARLKR